MHSLLPSIQFYASTASGPKDLIIILDLSTPPTGPFITSHFAEAALYILSSLSYLDYFTIVAGRATFQRMLVGADNDAIENAVGFLSTLNYQAASKDSEIQTAFDILTNSRVAGLSTSCQSSLVIITDVDVTEETVQTVEVLNQRFTDSFSYPVKIFLNSFGELFQRSAALDLVCENQGVWNVIDPSEFGTPSAIREKVISYYRVLASAGSVNLRTPLWSLPYSDPFGLGTVTSVCLPVFDTAIDIGELLGVSCISVRASAFDPFPNGAQVKLPFVAM